MQTVIARLIFITNSAIWNVIYWGGGKECSPSRFVWKIGGVLTAVLVLGVGIAALIPGAKIGWMFGEGDLMTCESFFALLMCGSIARRIWLMKISKMRGDVPAEIYTWKYLSTIFIFLAFDELLRIHELADGLIHRLAGVRPNDITDHLDDLFVALYGVVGLIILIRGRKELRHYISVYRYFIGAAVFTIFSIALDFLDSAKPLLRPLFPDPQTLQRVVDILDVGEESSKIYAELFFVGAFLACYVMVRGRTAST